MPDKYDVINGIKLQTKCAVWKPSFAALSLTKIAGMWMAESKLCSALFRNENILFYTSKDVLVSVSILGTIVPTEGIVEECNFKHIIFSSTRNPISPRCWFAFSQFLSSRPYHRCIGTINLKLCIAGEINRVFAPSLHSYSKHSTWLTKSILKSKKRYKFIRRNSLTEITRTMLMYLVTQEALKSQFDSSKGTNNIFSKVKTRIKVEWNMVT